jgi:MoaA/NifB/PqqE/SkfB family radical SAM enzyme
VGLQCFTYARDLFHPKRLESLFLFITSTCNSLCRTCFYWEELNQARDLTFDQLVKISRTAPAFHKLWVSGGEPFLRKDLAEIVEVFYLNNGVRHVNLPTNGLLPEKLASVISQVLERCPELVIDLNFSLDGLANTHDAIRGVPNNFEKTLSTIKLAAQEWKGISRLRRNVVSCVNAENYKELVVLGLRLLRESDLDGHYFEIIRGDPIDASLKRIPREELAALHRRLLWIHDKYSHKLFSTLKGWFRDFARAYYLGHLKFHFDLHEQNQYTNKAWPMACTAGQTTVVIDHDGSFRACELRAKLARLQDFDFDLSAAIGSAQMQREVADIPRAQCWCTHSCWIHASATFSPKVQLFHIPWSYLKHRWQRLPAWQVAELENFRVVDAPVLQ